jgi:hypothetical protein
MDHKTLFPFLEIGFFYVEINVGQHVANRNGLAEKIEAIC